MFCCGKAAGPGTEPGLLAAEGTTALSVAEDGRWARDARLVPELEVGKVIGALL